LTVKLRKQRESRRYTRVKKKLLAAVAAICILAAAFFIGTGFQKRTDVVLTDYSVSDDGTSICFDVAIASSMGYVRGFKDDGGGVKSKPPAKPAA